jgi:hypothetical protein
MEYLLLLSPVIIGIIIGLINNPAIDNNVDKFQNWLSDRKQKITSKSGKLNRFLIRPFLWLALNVRDWTNNISHNGMKAGIRIAVYIYLGALFLYLFITFAIIVAIIIMIGIAFWIYEKVSGGSPGSATGTKRRVLEYQDKNAMNHAGLKGKNIYYGTNWLNEELKGRVDEEGNIYKGTNWLNEEKIGRIDGDGNILQGTNSFNEVKVGRIDKDGNLQKGTNWFNEEKIGRIDKDGNIQKGTNWFNEEKQGRTGD